MKRNIEVWNPSHILEGDLEKSVLKKETISREEIRNYAKAVVDAFRGDQENDPEKKRLMILDMLSDDRIKRRIESNEDIVDLSKEEVSSVLQRVRETLMDELGNELDPDEFAIIKKDIRNSKLKGEHVDVLQEMKTISNKNISGSAMNRISEIEYSKSRGKKEKVFRTAEAYVEADEATKKEIQEAHEILRISQKNENYPGIIEEKEFDPESGEAVVKKLKLSDLAELVIHTKAGEIYQEDALSRLEFIYQAISACNWLKEKGLMVEDIKPVNIGIVEQDDGSRRVILHDLDGLHKLNSKNRLGLRPGDKNFVPPELTQSNFPPTNEEEEVFQLGASLKYILDVEEESYKRLFSATAVRTLNKVADIMTSPLAKDRINLADSQELLRKVIDMVKNEANELPKAA